MKQVFFIISFFIIIPFITGCSKQQNLVDNQDIHGPYLGQTPPGNTPQVFASGIISTAEHEAQLVAYPGGTSFTTQNLKILDTN
ncbi:MAG: hypothetical protein A2V66_05400 [Ignavibacteria bacterium RBG_13_36_8]|nr:MAG: hypothetical protein A2V66_05400 [Ignavibacteria bacterium RBG_13_36_8]